MIVLGTIVAALLIAVGLTGILVPVLPGSATVLGGLLVWALTVRDPIGWVVFGIGAVFVVCGMLATYVLTGRALKRRSIPSRSVVVGGICAIVGMFVVPIVGLPLGFALGLFTSEYVRVRDAREALSLSLEALKATGIGILAEFGLASLAGMTWVIGMLVYWL
ncbi:MAG TPA: DUF456 domain-containing protein [Propionibacteriaceae bacterium]|nr:DUF456 domain-containing protein [Propionibacteriaceae bacterium]